MKVSNKVNLFFAGENPRRDGIRATECDPGPPVLQQ